MVHGDSRICIHSNVRRLLSFKTDMYQDYYVYAKRYRFMKVAHVPLILGRDFLHRLMYVGSLAPPLPSRRSISDVIFAFVSV